MESIFYREHEGVLGTSIRYSKDNGQQFADIDYDLFGRLVLVGAPSFLFNFDMTQSTLIIMGNQDIFRLAGGGDPKAHWLWLNSGHGYFDLFNIKDMAKIIANFLLVGEVGEVPKHLVPRVPIDIVPVPEAPN